MIYQLDWGCTYLWGMLGKIYPPTNEKNPKITKGTSWIGNAQLYFSHLAVKFS